LTRLLCKLLGHIDRHITEALKLTCQTTTIDKPTASDQRKFFACRGKNIVVAIDNFYSALGTRRNTPTNRLYVNAVIFSQVHNALAGFDLKFDILWNEFYFHFMSP
jgi:hypothetical protein